ncbi:bifunctional ADP-dependent NAD(P)H-hydrate dehydratase/NAD(P)H-hydrate epimerase [Candidatus Accumulibacter cognatus]|uniref:Bifunctional NAD(P)H-hydrate repair enzyme n=1 Tax=Candidatus Accumulibacter cognatus TaxID=2954383 RepID=A0A080M096_9PROT|nr:bifunctional ADP-dependent NAD(P)H-hydrate dehydratase/NAD(P)H-hydrate epimerase [Candidatus Accumulibacter cognatus]KFB74677.1 MAG: Nicotinamide nucleotide repair protein [Candidatus Accumulibacter cognatus]
MKTGLRSQALYRAADLRNIETVAADQPLMERAGLAAADLATSLCRLQGGALLVLAGPGNNGGDAFVAARHLRERRFAVSMVFVGELGRLPKDAAAACRRFIDDGGSVLESIPSGQCWALIIDGLFGIGLQRPIGGFHSELVLAANTLAARDRCPLLALDCPSGLDADTGKLCGETIRASHTITFIAAKPGLFTADGPDHCGSISVATLDLNAERLAKATARTIGTDLFVDCLRPRAKNSHKGSHGSAGILGGASSMVGAVFLAGRAALRLGSGRVYLGLLDRQAPAIDPVQPELMLRQPDALLAAGLSALACGPGMGSSDQAVALLERASSLDLPLVLDADALNLLAGENRLQQAVVVRRAPTLLTPHPAEAARLLGCDTPFVQSDRAGAALAIAKRYQAMVVLKGCGSVIATPAGHWFVNTSGNPGLATAGSGDVLSGFIVALLAQGWPALETLLAAVHLHGAAADELVASGCGPVGLTAGELIDSARAGFNRWLANGR